MFTGSIGDIISSFTLPVLTLAIIISIAGESRRARASILEIKNAEYIRTARAKGLPERRVVGRHMMRNIMLVMVTIWALDFSALLGGAVITESIFSWPGLGRLRCKASLLLISM
ncbi:MAG: ABC transporter permease [Acidimicrobiales bacterium]